MRCSCLLVSLCNARRKRLGCSSGRGSSVSPFRLEVYAVNIAELFISHSWVRPCLCNERRPSSHHGIGLPDAGQCCVRETALFSKTFDCRSIANAELLAIVLCFSRTQRGQLTSIYNSSWYMGSIVGMLCTIIAITGPPFVMFSHRRLWLLRLLAAWACFAAFKRKDGSAWAWRYVNAVDIFRRSDARESVGQTSGSMVFLALQDPIRCAGRRIGRASPLGVLHSGIPTMARLSRQGERSTLLAM